MRPNTPSRIHPSRLLLSPRLSPVPSVDILSSTSAIAGAAVAAIASSDAPAPLTAAAVAIPSGPARTARATTEVAAAALTVAMAAIYVKIIREIDLAWPRIAWRHRDWVRRGSGYPCEHGLSGRGQPAVATWTC
uniref:Uncharacterized protein n=1 Tax=Oryza nivara TaxID=4536 RepID=A0A0E0FTU4_ORYNI